MINYPSSLYNVQNVYFFLNDCTSLLDLVRLTFHYLHNYCEDSPRRRNFGADIWTYFIVEICDFINWQKPWQTNIHHAFIFHWYICIFLYFPLNFCIINQINLCTITVKFVAFLSLVIFCNFNFRALG